MGHTDYVHMDFLLIAAIKKNQNRKAEKTMKTEMNTVKVRKTEELEAEQLGAHIGEIVRLHGSIYKIRK